jgi:hypothetical protein
MRLNSSPSYLDDHAKQVFDCTMENGVKLPSKAMFFEGKAKQFSTCYMFHKHVATSNSGIAEDLLNNSYDAQLNVTLQTAAHLCKVTDYNKGRAKMTNVGFSQLYVPILALVCLVNDCNLPTTKFSKCFDEKQRVNIVRVRKGAKVNISADVKEAFHHNIKVILKYFEALMPSDKYEHIFGFSCVKEMSATQKSKYYTEIPPFLRSTGKFQCNVNRYGVTNSVPYKLDTESNSKFAYQLMLLQDLKSSITYYYHDIPKLKLLKMNGKVAKGKVGGYNECFFVKPNPMATCGPHFSVLGWHSYDKVIVKGGKEYWVPPPEKLEMDLSSEDEECDDEIDDDDE